MPCAKKASELKVTTMCSRQFFSIASTEKVFEYIEQGGILVRGPGALHEMALEDAAPFLPVSHTAPPPLHRRAAPPRSLHTLLPLYHRKVNPPALDRYGNRKDNL